MKFRIENVGKVQFAEIEINGLTVLTGENSIGKSAIGKAIFSLVKSRNGILNRLSQMPIEALFSPLNKISDYLFKDEESKKKFIERTPALTLSLNRFNNSDIFSINDDIKLYIDEVREEVYKAAFLEKNDKEVEKHLHELEFEISKLLNREDLLKKNFDHMMFHVFHFQFSNQLNPNKTSTLSLTAMKKELISVEIENNKIKHYEAEFFMPIKDTTIIESSYILNLFNFIRNSLAFGRGANQSIPYKGLPYHLFDLMEKLSSSNNFNDSASLLQNIEKIIEGRVSVDNTGNHFSFTDQSNQSYSILNTASGVKTFGLLQLLLSSNCLNKQSLLIIDEPEVHLHPIWQLEYAKILVQMAKSGIPILLASHSPYFIEALKVYSDKEIPDQTKFYFGEMQEKGSVFKDVTNDLEPIFELLATPMQQLIIEK